MQKARPEFCGDAVKLVTKLAQGVRLGYIASLGCLGMKHNFTEGVGFQRVC